MSLLHSVKLVRWDGLIYDYTVSHEPLRPNRQASFVTRIAFAAAHVVVDPSRTAKPLTDPVIDWDATLAYREYLWSLGFGVAEAMDTAQPGMGLSWPVSLELIQRRGHGSSAAPETAHSPGRN